MQIWNKTKTGLQIHKGPGRFCVRMILFVIVLFVAVFLVEFFNSTLSSSETLTASVEWVAIAAGINTKGVTFDGGTGFEFVTAGSAYDFNSVIVGMNSFFHNAPPSALGSCAILK